jgi:hypothetical protein
MVPPGIVDAFCLVLRRAITAWDPRLAVAWTKKGK